MEADNEMDVCPQCSQCTTNANSRLIQDACGHKKCRLCLLKEEDGCNLCRMEVVNENNKELQAPEEIFLPEAREETQKSQDLPHRLVDVGSKAEKISKKRKSFVIGDHILILQGSPQRFRCTICNKVCKNKKSLHYHKFCASKKKPFTCEICSKEFVAKHHYEYHIKIHTGSCPFMCSVCGKGFKQNSHLIRHTKLLHNAEDNYICQDCGSTFKCSDYLKNHQRTHSDERPYTCNICPKSFSDSSNFKKHLQSHKGEKIFMCDECGKRFVFKKDLSAHLYIHTRERNHVCQVCKRRFAIKKDLKRHEMVHTAVHPHTCSLCDLVFRRKDNLERHMKNTHPETRISAVGSHASKSACVNVRREEEIEKITNAEGCTDGSSTVAPIPPSQTIDANTLCPVVPPHNAGYQPIDCAASLQGDNEMMNVADSSAPNVPVMCGVGSIVTNCQGFPERAECSERMPEAANCSLTQAGTNSVIDAHNSLNVSKKNTEYYRAVPVINRHAAVATVSDLSDYSSSNKSNSACVERLEGTNCVPTITRASESCSGSVITVNRQKSVSTIVKPQPKLECYRRIEACPPALCEPVNTYQPTLRMLLNDVDCSDGSPIMNLVEDIDKQGSAYDTQQKEKVCDKLAQQVGAEFYHDKFSDIYSSQSHVPTESDMQSQVECYSNSCAKTTYYEDCGLRNNYNQNIIYEDLTVPNYMCNITDNRDMERCSFPDGGYSSAYSRISDSFSSLGMKTLDCGESLKLLADVAGSDLPAVGQPVIVGAGKVTNVICSNMH